MFKKGLTVRVCHNDQTIHYSLLAILLSSMLDLTCTVHLEKQLNKADVLQQGQK